MHTEVQAGPLYRVVGTPLLISCNVSGFKNVDTRKEFQIRVKLPATSSPMNIISSSNQGFGYALYKKRVRDKEISLTHVSPNSINFEIHRLQKNDEGEYECSVVNEDGAYDGTYGATTIVKGNQSTFKLKDVLINVFALICCKTTLDCNTNVTSLNVFISFFVAVL